MNLYKKCTAKPYSFLVIDATLASDNLLRFRKNLVERIKKIIMSTDDKSRETKTVEGQDKKQIDAIPNQNERVEALTNKDDHESIYKEIFDKLVKAKFDRIKELTYKIDHDDLMYYFKNDTARKFFNDFDSGIELFRKIQPGEMKLEDAKELQNIFKSNLNEISKGRFKSKEQISALENIRFLHES